MARFHTRRWKNRLVDSSGRLLSLCPSTSANTIVSGATSALPLVSSFGPPHLQKRGSPRCPHSPTEAEMLQHCRRGARRGRAGGTPWRGAWRGEAIGAAADVEVGLSARVDGPDSEIPRLGVVVPSPRSASSWPVLRKH